MTNDVSDKADKRAAIANIVIDAVKHVRQRPAGLRGPYVFNDEELDRLIALAAPPPQPEVAGLVEAARDVMAERERQKSVEGWTVEHDDKHKAGELARAAGIYALIAGSDPTTYRNALCGFSLNDFAEAAMSLWPWSGKWFKPTNRRRDLVKAGALILAEIERLDRAALASMDGGPK